MGKVETHNKLKSIIDLFDNLESDEKLEVISILVQNTFLSLNQTGIYGKSKDDNWTLLTRARNLIVTVKSRLKKGKERTANYYHNMDNSYDDGQINVHDILDI